MCFLCIQIRHLTVFIFLLDLIGLNWVDIAMDAYSIEKARLRQLGDNCADLLKKSKHYKRCLKRVFLIKRYC